MGIEGRGRYSPTHLMVEPAGDDRIDKAQIEDCLTGHAIDFGRSAKMSSTEDRNIGWATSSEVDEADFSKLDSWDFNSVSLIYWREDRKVIDTAAKKRVISSRIKAWLEENNRQRCPATVKAEIKLNVDTEMALKAQVKAKIVEVAIHWDSRWAVISCQTDSTVDVIIKLLNQTFKGAVATFSRKRVDDMIEGDADENFGVKLIEKLWNKLDQDGDLSIDGAAVELGSTAILSSERGKTTIKGDLTREEIEAAAAAGGRKVFEALGIKLTRSERDFELTILADRLTMKDLVRPPFMGDSKEADLLIGMDLYSEAHKLVCSLARWSIDNTSGEE